MKPIKTGWKTWPAVVIIRYWIFQGALYMNWAERAHRWSMELLVFVALYFLFTSIESELSLLVALVVAHTLSAIFNGHVFAMLTHDLFWFGAYKEKTRVIRYVDEMHARINRKQPSCVAGAIFFGSLVRGVFRTTSDLDIRIIAKNGFWDGFCAAHFVFVERFHALFAGFPIDVYMFRTEKEIREKMDVVNEKPVSLYEDGDMVRRAFPEVADYEEFRPKFLASSVDE